MCRQQPYTKAFQALLVGKINHKQYIARLRADAKKRIKRMLEQTANEKEKKKFSPASKRGNEAHAAQ